MTVYVDDPIWPYGRMKMCHMAADSIEELHEMADKIGIRRRWFQNQPAFPHYDICKSKRQLAIEKGAVEVSARFLAKRYSEEKKRILAERTARLIEEGKIT